MDPATLATAALTILTPFAKDIAKDLVKTVGETAVEKAKGLMTWLKQKLVGDESASKDLSRFEADPDKFEPSLEATIKEKVEQDPEFAAELKKRIDEIGPTITVFQQIKKGKKVVGVDAEEVRSGKVGVTQMADEVEDLTAVHAKKIG